jgi:EAL domain-containing protein (putative c-di-GMP-specific phosphodiesterase class I)
MYRVKESGRGRYMFFEENMNREIVHRVEMETDMRRAFERNEFVLHYQPQIELQTGKIVGVEALIRWNHPTQGLILPQQFIPLAEECGLIERLGEWILRTACEQYRAWCLQDLSPGSIAVNISSRQFMREDLADTIRKIIDETGISPAELQLEITESLLLDERINANSVFRSLEAMGVHLAIDDFGTGYSSLSYLKRFPVGILKIDRSFTLDIPADTQATTLTLSIITMAHALNMQVVAEGIEREDQLALLKAHQCDVAQGNYISEALPEAQLLAYLRRNLGDAASSG